MDWTKYFWSVVLHLRDVYVLVIFMFCNAFGLYSYFPHLNSFNETWNHLILLPNERIKRKVRCWHCSDIWENLIPINMFLICYNYSPSQVMKAPHNLSLWRPLHRLTSKCSLPSAADATVHPSDQGQSASAAARNWLSLWRAFICSAYGELS